MSPDAPVPSVASQFNWRTWVIDKIAPALIMLVIGTGLGYWMQSKAPKLVYSVGQVVQFAGEKDEFGLIVVTVSNQGNKEAENVQCVIDLKDCEIQDLKSKPRELRPVTEIKGSGDEAHITAESLNPGEFLSLHIKATGPEKLENDIEVRARAKGVNAVKGNSIAVVHIFPFWATLGIFLGPIIAAILIGYYQEAVEPKTLRFIGGPLNNRSFEGEDVKQFCNRYGWLNNEFEAEGEKYLRHTVRKTKDNPREFWYVCSTVPKFLAEWAELVCKGRFSIPAETQFSWTDREGKLHKATWAEIVDQKPTEA